MMREPLIATLLVLVVTCSSALAETNIETKYLMFKLPVVSVEAIDKLAESKQLKADLGKGAYLHTGNVRRVQDRLSSDKTVVLQITEQIRIDAVSLNPGCLMRFYAAKEISFRLGQIDCADGSIEYEGVKIKANYSSFDSLTRNHFYANELTADSKIPLPNGKFLYPGDKISVIEWVAIAPTNLFKLEKK